MLTMRRGLRENRVSTYTFTKTIDPFTETNFVGGHVITSNSSNDHEPFVGYSSNGGEPESLREVNIAGAIELAGATAVFLAGAY